MEMNMLSKVTINEELTFATFGYNISDLPNGSHSKIVVTCDNCHTNVHRERRNANANHKCPIIDGNTKRCYKCEQWKDLSFFNKSRKMSGGVSKLCKECYNKEQAVIKCSRSRSLRFKHAIENGDIEFYIKRRIGTIKSRAEKNGINFDLDSEYLINLWNSQSGRCFYSNIPMNNSMKQDGFQSWDGPSLDRIEPINGYVKGNVVWCAFGINSFKQSLNLQSFEDAIRSIDWWYKNKTPPYNGEPYGNSTERFEQPIFSQK
jgi:hypothetical protein